MSVKFPLALRRREPTKNIYPLRRNISRAIDFPLDSLYAIISSEINFSNDAHMLLSRARPLIHSLGALRSFSVLAEKLISLRLFDSRLLIGLALSGFDTRNVIFCIVDVLVSLRVYSEARNCAIVVRYLNDLGPSCIHFCLILRLEFGCLDVIEQFFRFCYEVSRPSPSIGLQLVT
ncbi:unnamed protein product [Citrullus colocynthis]|uniref:Uncharacterized protein n=1 Tax=Citrullus colocynthis TaxID=252529 RepID=A0ABP0Y7V5_9ROSI